MEEALLELYQSETWDYQCHDAYWENHGLPLRCSILEPFWKKDLAGPAWPSS